MSKNTIDDLTRLVDFVDDRSKFVGEITGIIKGVVSKDPGALDDNFAEYILKNTFGESKYDLFRNIYLDIISSKKESKIGD